MDETSIDSGEDPPTLSEENRYRLLVENITDYAVFMLDAAGRVSSWNPGAARIKGYSEAEILGRHFSCFYSEDDQRSGLPQRGLATAAAEGRFEYEGWRVRKDGTRFWAHVVIDPVRNKAGRIVGFAKITRDLTERRNVQLALEKTREELFQSQKLDAIGRLTGGVAHDFNNLLMAILGSLTLVRKRLPEDPRITPLVDNAIHAANRGANLSKRMLAFARREELKPSPVDVATVLRGMTDLIQRSIGPFALLETHFPLNLPFVMADANQLELAILNLVVNARDAMPNGGTIGISAEEKVVSENTISKPLNGTYVCISVVDAGEGMDEATLKRATEPFFTTKDVGKGTGLGLSMVHGMAEQLGGRLILHSQPGSGTRAEIWLPIATTIAVEESEDRSPDKKRTHLVILAVDDDAMVLLNLVAMLEDLGYKTYSASSGKRALEILDEEKSIDVVVTDYAMPNMTGDHLALHILAKRPNLPIVMATGFEEYPPGVKAPYPKLTKPYSQEDLGAVIEQVVARR